MTQRDENLARRAASPDRRPGGRSRRCIGWVAAAIALLPTAGESSPVRPAGAPPDGARGEPPAGVRGVHEPAPAGLGQRGAGSCDQGIAYDDGTFESFFGASLDLYLVMHFDLPAAAVPLRVCVCWMSLGVPETPYEVVFYDDDGPGGAPGTPLGSVPAFASGIPTSPSWRFYEVDTADAGIGPGGQGLYVGVLIPSSDAGLLGSCVDESPTTPERPSYASFDGTSWESIPDFSVVWEDYRALGVRVVAADLIFADGFESGDTGGWSGAVGES